MVKPRYLFADLKKVTNALKDRLIYLFLDYDGTLSPIAETPGKAIMPDRSQDILRRLSGLANCKVAIVSGRPLKDISHRVGVKNIVYVGNHGFEIKAPGIRFKSPILLRHRRALEGVKARLEHGLSSIRGVFIEDKELSLSVHYRLADKKEIPAIEAEFYSALLGYELRGEVKTRRGKMVLEVTPPVPWDKGKAVLWLLAHSQPVRQGGGASFFPIYIGDDKTDEDAFESLKDRGMTIFVGTPKDTKARFYVKDPEEVLKFLEFILEKAG